MPTYVAFLRAINLGARRRFAKADVTAVTEAAGGADVATYLNTGNVRLTSTRRSTSAVATLLSTAYARDRGFEVPVIVFTPDELTSVVAETDALVAEHGEPQEVLVTLFAEPPTGAAAEAAQDLDLTDRVFVRDRAAVALLQKNVRDSPLLSRKEFKALGEGTARNIRVLREVAERWCR